jgi:hypothetical protein
MLPCELQISDYMLRVTWKGSGKGHLCSFVGLMKSSSVSTLDTLILGWTYHRSLNVCFTTLSLMIWLLGMNPTIRWTMLKKNITNQY